MTYRRSYRDTTFSAISEENLTNSSGESFTVGDSFIYTGADTSLTVRDNDSFLSGDSYNNERGNDYQAGTVETASGTESIGNVYAESFYVLRGSDGRYYYLVEIEGTGLSNDLAKDDLFTFFGAVPPAGTSLTAVSNHNVLYGVKYSGLGAGEVDDGNNGENDAPTVAAAVSAEMTEDDAAFTVDLLEGASDVDTSDELNVAGLALVSGDDSGVTIIGNTLDVDPSAYNSLAVTESAVIEYSYTVEDGNGGSVEQTATITITGENDAPTVAAAVSAEMTEDDAAFTVDLLEGASDVDTSDELNVAGLALVSGDDSGVTISGNTLDVDPSAYNSLAVNESAVIEYSYTVEDGNGDSVAQTATITIIGANDAPFVIVGTAGNDVLIGGGGDDTFTGGAGDDEIRGGDGIDTVDYSSEDGTLGVNVSLGEPVFTNSPVNARDTFGDGDTLIDIENVIGTSGGDQISGSAEDNVINGGAGADIITGRGGNDRLTGGEFGGMGAGDTFVFNQSDAAGETVITDFVAGAGNGDLFNVSTYGFADFETLELNISAAGGRYTHPA